MFIGFLLVQFFLPLLLPWGKWLNLGLVLCAISWAIIWHLYNEPADERGLTLGGYLFCNIIFIIIITLRFLAKLSTKS
jgi:hypothetical protein